MNDAIYQQAIKQLAQAAYGSGRLDTADYALRLDNPLCGDRIDMQVRLVDGRIAALGYEIKGCLLCRAAAAIVGKQAAGRDSVEIEAARTSLAAMLAMQVDAAANPLWPDFRVPAATLAS